MMEIKLFDTVELTTAQSAKIKNIFPNYYLAEVMNSSGLVVGDRYIRSNDIKRVLEH